MSPLWLRIIRTEKNRKYNMRQISFFLEKYNNHIIKLETIIYRERQKTPTKKNSEIQNVQCET